VSSWRPSIPYMICKEPSGFNSEAGASIQFMNLAASSVKPMRSRPYKVKAASRIQVYR